MMIDSSYIARTQTQVRKVVTRINVVEPSTLTRQHLLADSEIVHSIRSEWFGDYVPTAKAIAINVERINKRLSGDKT